MDKTATRKGKVPKISEEEYEAYVNALKLSDCQGEEGKEEDGEITKGAGG